jgi:hypothetical protein
MNQNDHARVVCAVLWLLAALPAAAGGPYTIHRSFAADEVAASVPVATVAVAPFDDAPGLLGDGARYFYRVYDASGTALHLSVSKNAALQTVRVGFDDGDPASAPVDPARSTVSVSPVTILADGASLAVVTIVPRDAAGIPLGSGLAVELDAALLWPGLLAGAVEDRGNGTYVARVLSMIPGTGVVVAAVEGVELASQPTITYQSAGPLTLRQLAILQLEALVADGGRFDALVSGLDPNTDPGAAHVAESQDAANAALDALLSGASSGDVDAVRVFLKESIDELVAALEDPGAVDPEGIEALIDDLLDISRLLAQYYLDAAEAACGPCQAGEPRDLCDATAALTEGDALRVQANPNPSAAANRYGKAVAEATKAEESCS